MDAVNDAGATMITVAGDEKNFSSFIPRLAIGPEVTVRLLSARVTLQHLQPQYWKPSLGDLEVF
jgi:hypothetical protein